MSFKEEYEEAQERGYVTAEEIERWSGTDRSTRFKRWWYAPDGITRWDDLKNSVTFRLILWFGRNQACGCTVLTKRRLRFWCGDHFREALI